MPVSNRILIEHWKWWEPIFWDSLGNSFESPIRCCNHAECIHYGNLSANLPSRKGDLWVPGSTRSSHHNSLPRKGKHSLNMFEHLSNMDKTEQYLSDKTHHILWFTDFTMILSFFSRISKHVWNTCFLRVSHVWKIQPVEGACFPVEGACFSVWKHVFFPCFWWFWGSSFYHILSSISRGYWLELTIYALSLLISIFPGQFESWNCCIQIHDAQGLWSGAWEHGQSR